MKARVELIEVVSLDTYEPHRQDNIRPCNHRTIGLPSCGVVQGLVSNSRVSVFSLAPRIVIPLVSLDSPSNSRKHRLGFTILSAYTLTFQTHLFSILPPSFARGFKALCASTLSLPLHVDPTRAAPAPDSAIWAAFETLGLVDRYESLIASVGYEHIEAHVLSACTGKWAEPMISGLRDWMSDKIVPWMLLPYARGASTSEWQYMFYSGLRRCTLWVITRFE